MFLVKFFLTNLFLSASQQSGITYYTPQTQMPPRPILPQRRPTNAIPILAPPDRVGAGGSKHQHHQHQHHHHRKNTQDGDRCDTDDNATTQSDKLAATAATIGSPENIDHILDNMFVQRAPYQPPNAQQPQQQQQQRNKNAADDAGTTDSLKSDSGIVA